MKEFIHQGRIEEVHNGKVRIRINRQSACVSCTIARHCMVSDTKQESIWVKDSTCDWKEGQEVQVRIAASLAGRAVVWAYVLPVVLLLLVLIVVSFLGKSDGEAALWSLGMLVVYYGFLYICRNVLQRKIRFSITPIE